MREQKFDFTQVESCGKVTVEAKNGALIIRDTLRQNTRFYQKKEPIFSYVQLPGRFKIPLRIDMTVNMNAPTIYLMLGRGHLNFGSFMDNRCIGDVVEPDMKTRSFYNQIAINEDVKISVLYSEKFMQIIVNGEIRWFSKKEKYMKSEDFSGLNEDGFALKIATDKHVCLCVKSLTVTEFNRDELMPISLEDGRQISELPPTILSIDKKAKSDFEECISQLSPKIAAEIRLTNDYLLNTKELKIKRKIEGTSKACKINYVSAHGFSYAVHVGENAMNHFFWWYMVSNYKFEGKFMGRKNDLTAETFERLEQLSLDIAKQLFSYYAECAGCGTGCSVKTIYELGGKKKAVCHGKMDMNMRIATFAEVRLMLDIIREIISNDNHATD